MIHSIFFFRKIFCIFAKLKRLIITLFYIFFADERLQCFFDVVFGDIEEIKNIESYTFFGYRITNDLFETGYNDLKNAMFSLYPYLKYKESDIEELKKMIG